ncbi:uncharacterized protein LOC18427592 isoform X1 [Amborella trichopoda]|uniref:uncharacterized protein LOC18427592 isoform X1 n=1 Tax=Amborella trichopoda TaxID=13333 RepID=UPI0005D2DC4C|nr:uncharacterized protein LOC18427592 isoform X1 [Amborella trichopoda]|eukprot:XP_011620902.1 uncharacterized protein LOC18427592 isoform X1 [Amborella trichopoda]
MAASCCRPFESVYLHFCPSHSPKCSSPSLIHLSLLSPPKIAHFLLHSHNPSSHSFPATSEFSQSLTTLSCSSCSDFDSSESSFSDFDSCESSSSFSDPNPLCSPSIQASLNNPTPESSDFSDSSCYSDPNPQCSSAIQTSLNNPTPESSDFPYSSSSSDLNSQYSPSNPTSVKNPAPDILELKRAGGFLDEMDLKSLQLLEDFLYIHEFDHGILQVRVMDAREMEMTVELLADSFAETMWSPFRYVPLLRVLVRQHLMERRAVLPHAATLVGFYSEEGGELELAGTVEISFNARGANAIPPTPNPPMNSPYLCNMSVKKQVRRRGIGWHLLKASEELVPQIGLNEIYLHCRMIDTPALNMYKKANYNVVETDNILTLLSLQRRKYLMYKKLSPPKNLGIFRSL